MTTVATGPRPRRRWVWVLVALAAAAAIMLPGGARYRLAGSYGPGVLQIAHGLSDAQLGPGADRRGRHRRGEDRLPAARPLASPAYSTSRSCTA